MSCNGALLPTPLASLKVTKPGREKANRQSGYCRAISALSDASAPAWQQVNKNADSHMVV